MEQYTETMTAASAPTINLTSEERAAFVTAVKIGYYKEFYRQGLITGSQLELLLSKQKNSLNQPTA